MKPFLQGKKTLTGPALRAPAHGLPTLAGVHAPGTKSSHAAGGAGDHGADGAHVEVVKQGDKVTRLIVTCACGEKIEIDCLYPAGV